MCYRIHSYYNKIINLEKDLRVYKLIRQRVLTNYSTRGFVIRLEGPYQSSFEFKEGETHCEPDFGKYEPYGCKKNRKGEYRRWEVDEGFHCFSNFKSAIHKARYFSGREAVYTSIVLYEATVPAGCNIRYNPKTSIILADCLRLDRVAHVDRVPAMLGWTRDLVNNLLRPKDPMLPFTS